MLKPQKICDMVRAGHPARPSASTARRVRFGPAESPLTRAPPRAPSSPPSQLFDSVSKNDLITYLACTGSVTREERSAGTFKCTAAGDGGRELHRAYKTRYVYLRERDVEGEEGVACAVTYLRFGPVAGYREGATFEYIDETGG